MRCALDAEPPLSTAWCLSPFGVGVWGFGGLGVWGFGGLGVCGGSGVGLGVGLEWFWGACVGKGPTNHQDVLNGLRYQG